MMLTSTFIHTTSTQKQRPPPNVFFFLQVQTQPLTFVALVFWDWCTLCTLWWTRRPCRWLETSTSYHSTLHRYHRLVKSQHVHQAWAIRDSDGMITLSKNITFSHWHYITITAVTCAILKCPGKKQTTFFNWMLSTFFCKWLCGRIKNICIIK